MADCQRVLFIHGKAAMKIGTTQTLTKGFLDGKTIVGNVCKCGSEGYSCCNGDRQFEDGCDINRWKWYSSDPTILTVDEGPNSTTVATAIKHGVVTVSCNGYSHWYCDRTCNCNGCSSSSTNPSWRCTMWDSSSQCVHWEASTQYWPDGCNPGQPLPEWRDSGTIRVAQWQITVYDPAKMKQYVFIDGKARVQVGGTQTLTATTKTTSETYTWTSENEDIATVTSPGGVVTGVSRGVVVVTAEGDTSEEKSTFQIEVVGVTDPRVLIIGRSTIESGEEITYEPSETCEEPTTWNWATSGSLVGADGTYTGGGVGSGTVTATSVKSSQSDSFTTQVVAAGTQFIAISGPSWVGVGDTVVYGATRRNFTTGMPFVWTSLDLTKATVDRNTGAVTGVATGPVTITVTSGGVTESFIIDIQEPVEKQPSLQYVGSGRFEMSVDDGISTELMCDPYPSGTTLKYEWMSTNRFIATVNETLDGSTNTVHPIKEGIGGVQIRPHGFVATSITQPFDVVPKQGAFVAIEADSVLFDLSPVLFTATTVDGTDTDYTWKTIGTNDPPGQFFADKKFHPTKSGTVTIQATGVQTGATGTAVIKIVLRESTYGHEHIGKTAACPTAKVNMQVMPATAPNIFVVGKSVLGVGEKYEFNADAPCGDVVGEYVWGANLPDMIKFQEDYQPTDPEYYGPIGYSHAYLPGSVSVRVTERLNEEPKTKFFSFLPVTILEYWFCVENAESHLAVGDTLSINIAQGLSFPEATYTVTSDTPSIATVAGTTITAVAVGTATIRIKGNTTQIEKTFNLTVVDPDPGVTEDLPIITYRTVLVPGAVETFSCTVLNPVDSFFGIWYSSDDAIAQVSGNDNTCDVTPGPQGGIVTITYEDLLDPTITSSVTIYVPPYNAPLAVEYQNKLVQSNDYTFEATTLVDVTETYTWRSSDEWVATVDSTGKVTAKHGGTCKISVQGQTTRMRGEVELRVYDAFVTITGWSNIREGESRTFVAESYCVTEIYDWYSSDFCRATVTSGGVVTGHVRGTAIITAIGRTTGQSSSWEVTIEFVSQTYMRSSIRSASGSSTYNSSGSTSIPACWMSSSSSVFSSSWAKWFSSQSCSSDSDLGVSSCSWSSWSSMYSSSWTVYYPYQYSSSLWTSSWSSSGTTSWRQCDVYYVPETHDMQFLTVQGPNRIRIGEYANFEVTGFNEGNVWYPCCGSEEGDYAWSTTGGLVVVELSGVGGKIARAIGVTASVGSISVTRGKHLLLHECFTKFNVLRDMVISCAAQCTDRSYLCQAYELPIISACDCKADAASKIDQYYTLMETIKNEPLCQDVV